MAPATFSIRILEGQTGVSARTLRSWVRERLLPRPVGRGRGARYDARHVLRARVVQHYREKGKTLREIRARMNGLSEQQLAALLPPPPRATTPDGVPVPPPAPSYPSTTWEVVPLMDGISLMVNPARGAVVRRIADEIYRYYGGAR